MKRPLLENIMRLSRASILALALFAACDDNGDDLTGPDGARMYNQLQRLGNPLVSEVFLAKRSHPTHGSIGPAADATHHRRGVQELRPHRGREKGGRSRTPLRPCCFPDMLIVQSNKATNTAGWLSWALADGWGGRNLATTWSMQD